MKKKVDEELVKVIEDAMRESKSCLEAFDKVVEWKKKNRGLTGLHVSPPLDVMCGQRTIDDPKKEAEKMAHDILFMDLAYARGHYKDVTNEEL